MMLKLQPKRILITGGSRGVGAALVQTFLENGDEVLAVSRSAENLSQLNPHKMLSTIVGDVRDLHFASEILSDVSPDVLILNAGVIGAVKPVTDQSWEEFSETWNTDVRATLYWGQEIMKLPPKKGRHVLVMSSGAAIAGSLLTGGYSGAKRMQWMMTDYFRTESAQQGLGIRFTTVIPQMTGDTKLSRPAAEAYSQRKGVSPEDFLKSIGVPHDRFQLAGSICDLVHKRKYRNFDTVFVDGNGPQEIDSN